MIRKKNTFLKHQTNFNKYDKFSKELVFLHQTQRIHPTTLQTGKPTGKLE